MSCHGAAIAITEEANTDELEDIVGTRDRIFPVSYFSELIPVTDRVKDALAQKCGPRPTGTAAPTRKACVFHITVM